MLLHQQHLNYQNTVNLGAYYTNNNCINMVWKMLDGHIDEGSVVLDSSCGYGNFLDNDYPHVKIGSDIDEAALSQAKKNVINATFSKTNSLEKVSRFKYNISETDKLCIVGNPPYNDRTSIIRNNIKKVSFNIDNDIKTRDLGISFLLSYQKLSADIICVLHPLSYLIKKTNFNLLKNFTNKYQLLTAQIISSHSFANASKSMSFPIVIVLYKQDKDGMDYSYIKNFNFTIKNQFFRFNDFDYIGSYINKYPNKNQQPKENDILFWTIRDINALKRNRSFISKFSTNTIIIDKDKLDYYIYVDVFKKFSSHVPYYFGNCDVIIDNQLFLEYKEYFILECLTRQKQLRKYFIDFDLKKLDLVSLAQNKINEYFIKLLGKHYVY